MTSVWVVVDPPIEGGGVVGVFEDHPAAITVAVGRIKQFSIAEDEENLEGRAWCSEAAFDEVVGAEGSVSAFLTWCNNHPDERMHVTVAEHVVQVSSKEVQHEGDRSGMSGGSMVEDKAYGPGGRVQEAQRGLGGDDGDARHPGGLGSR